MTARPDPPGAGKFGGAAMEQPVTRESILADMDAEIEAAIARAFMRLDALAESAETPASPSPDEQSPRLPD